MIADRLFFFCSFLLLLIALLNSANSINKWKKKQMLRSAVQTRVLRLRDVQPKVIGERKKKHSKNDANLPGLREKRRKLDNFFRSLVIFFSFRDRLLLTSLFFIVIYTVCSFIMFILFVKPQSSQRQRLHDTQDLVSFFVVFVCLHKVTDSLSTCKVF